MYILDVAEKAVYNSECVERFLVSEKPVGALVIASIDSTRICTLGCYPTMDEAKGALYRLYCALGSREMYFEMPKPVIMEPVKRDARTARRGGS